MLIVPTVERLGQNADFVKEQHQTIADRCAPGAFPVVMAPRGADWRIEDGDLAGAPQAWRKLHVFHQRDFGESSQFHKDIPADENRLISKKSSAVPGHPAAHFFQPHQPGMPFVELPEKSPSNDCTILQRSFESAQVEPAEFRVRMLEDKNIAGRERGAVIHLLATTWCSEMRELGSVSSRNLFGRGIA